MKRVFVIFGIGLLTISCQPDEPQPVITNNGIMNCMLNGSQWTGITFNNTLQLNIIDGESNGKILELQGKDANGKQLTLRMASIINGEEENMETGDYLLTGEVKLSDVQYFGGGLTSGESTGSVNSPNHGHSEISLSEFNPEDNTCSGTFSFFLQDFQSGDTLYTGTNGQFTSMTYVLQE